MSSMFERLHHPRYGASSASTLPAGEFEESFARIEVLAKMLDSAIQNSRHQSRDGR